MTDTAPAPIIGHRARWDALRRAVHKGQTPQTLLISGPSQVGKTTFIIRYAQLLLCQNVQHDDEGLPEPCRACRACHQVEIGTFPDFRIFRPIISRGEPTPAPEELDSSLISVEVARDFGDEAALKPLSGGKKVLSLFQFERANEEAQNALLKTLEEPPSGTHLVLTSENPKRLRETIMSRCWHLQLAPTSTAEIESWLTTAFPDANRQHVMLATKSSSGRPGAAWREMKRLQEEGESSQSRFQIASRMLARLDEAAPVAALGMTEEALKWAKEWWDEDAGDEADAKKLGAKGQRAAAARFLDELTLAGRAQWVAKLDVNRQEVEVGAARLDQIRKTRQHILRNANLPLALDVMFGRLIALRPPRTRKR